MKNEKNTTWPRLNFQFFLSRKETNLTLNLSEKFVAKSPGLKKQLKKAATLMKRRFSGYCTMAKPVELPYKGPGFVQLC